jgi:hypothetical protein
MSSSSRCRRSAQLSRIARMVYGPVPARPAPSRPLISPLVVPSSVRSPRPQEKGGQRRGY